MQPHEADTQLDSGGEPTLHDGLSPPYVLVVDDEPDIRQLLQEILEDEGYEVGVAEDGESARKTCRARRPDLVLLDIWMPDVDGITLLKEWSEDSAPIMPVIMMSGHGTVETAVEATRLGAYDFIEKPLSLAKLLLTVEHALEADKLKRENIGLRRYAHAPSEPIGRSAVMQRLKEQVRRIAEHDSWVLVSGEPGSGVRVLARYLHASSTRRAGPFVEFNVGQLSAGDAAVQLFGSERDNKVHFGLLEQAQAGSLLLYDVADMDLDTQAKLLSALESGSFQRIGGIDPIPVNVRVIAATHRDLQELVAQGGFRQELYYRLNVVPLVMPPLREHREDVPDLLNYYVDVFVEHEQLPYRHFSVAAQNRLRNYSWPGNIRELENLVQRLLIIGSGPEVGIDDVEAALGAPPPTAAPAGAGTAVDFNLPLREAREQFERSYLEYQLRLHGGSVNKVAKAVGLERTHLYRKLRALGIDPKNLTAE